MKRFTYLVLVCCLSLGMHAAKKELDPAVILADTMYAAADYTVPSYTEFLIAKKAAVADASQANLQALVDKAMVQAMISPVVTVVLHFLVVTNVISLVTMI